MHRRQREQLATLVSNPVEWDRPLAGYTSFGIGGPAEALIKIEQRQELQRLLLFMKEQHIPWRVIGRGTNLLVRDEGFSGVILLLAGKFMSVEKQESIEKEKVILRAGAGASLTKCVENCVRWGLSGIEFGCGIPGTIGGAVTMNAGAWGSDISSVVHSVMLVAADGEERVARPELHFSYRCWDSFKKYFGKAIIAEVELELTRKDPAEIKKYCSELRCRRKNMQPGSHPNAGSFFKNPPGDSAGRLIDASGLKGATVGGAMVSEHHANFLVNRGGASAKDVLVLMRLVQSRVKKDSGIDLKPEVHIL